VTDESISKQSEHAQKVRTMFAGIAGRYDLLNHLLSGNTDKRWRRKVAQALKSALSGNSAVALDVACGTGDLSLVIARECGSRVIGTDFCRPMLAIAAEKASAGEHRIPFVEADALSLPFQSGYFDAASIAFGLRNLSDVERGLGELFRILKPGGRVAILEFSRPVVPGFRELFQFYFSRVLPLIGGWISGSRGAYEYLPDSVSRFPDQKRLASLMKSVGFTAVEYSNLTGGIAALHIGAKPKT
jgi:demethylmenaquinone methyltransferase / 2-methoxy-6-polyprenyl-1,4-benzoquinol methylase